MDELHYQIDLLNAMNQKLAIRDSMYEMICGTSGNAFIFYNFLDNHLEVLGNWNRFFDFQIVAYNDIKNILDCVEESKIFLVKEALFFEKTGKEQTSVEGYLTNKNIWVEFETTVNYNEYLQPVEKIIRIKNVTKFKSQYNELMYMAYYDALTGLYNRNNFIRVLTEWTITADKQDIISVMFIDIDDFHKINDGLGILIGDEVVQLLGQFLGEFQNDKVISSHFTSDLFCIAIYDPCEQRCVENIYKAIQERIRKPFILADKNEVMISVSYGVAEYPEAAETAIDLISYAEIVMFKSKSEGKGKIKYFNHSILESFLKNVEIEHKLKEAVFTQNFYLVFQPQYEIKSGVMRGVETLIRWKNDDKIISPGIFIPIAEKNNLIIPIGDWVIEESIKIFAEWKRKYQTSLILSINISAIQYKKKNFVSKLIAVLKNYNIAFQEIELEITESILIDEFQDIIKKMYQLREYGIRVSLDDFGTGFSSLSYLKGLPIDTLKIDKNFIDTIADDQSTRIILESIVTMVKKLGYETIAEGVETKEQYDYLKEIDCDNIQGFLLGKPMNPDEIEKLLIKQL